MDSTDIFIIALTILFMGQLFANRWLVRWLLLRVMLNKSDAETGPSEKSQSWAQKQSVASLAPLAIELLNLRPLPAAAQELTNVLATRARILLRWGTLLDIAAGVTFAVLTSEWHDINKQTGWQQSLSTFAVFIPILALLRYYFFRRQHMILGAESPDGWTVYAKIAYFLASPRWQTPMRWVMLLSAVAAAFESPPAGKSISAALLGVAAAQALAEMALHVYHHRWPGLSMLILRVFSEGNEVSEAVLFQHIQKTWAHFGRSFTILDTSLLKRRTRLMKFDLLLVMAVCYWFPLLGVVDSMVYGKLNWGDALGFAGYALVLLSIDFLWAYRRVAISRVDTRAKLQRLLKRRSRWPRNLDGRFARVEAACYDNTWRESVTEFAARSQVVLMNLSNFTPERNGCAEEVEWLFDHIPLERIVFMANKSDMEAVTQNLMSTCWRELKPYSPNLQLQAPKAQFYLLDDEQTWGRTEILLTWLQLIADRSLAADQQHPHSVGVDSAVALQTPALVVPVVDAGDPVQR